MTATSIELIEANVRRFFAWLNERHAIYLRRQRGDPWPWTEDEILQTYKFTNVYRELDTGTIWLRENVREPYADHPELFFNIAAYRRYNYWPMAEVIGYIEDYSAQARKRIINTIREYKAAGGQVFTGAHMLNSQNGMDKITYVFEHVLVDFWDKRSSITPDPNIDNLESSYHKVISISGFGPFISYETVTDLRWTRYLQEANDVMTWANAGPGAKRGVQRLMGLQISDEYGHKAPPEVRAQYPKYPEGYLDVMRTLLDISQEYLEAWMDPLEMRDIEHSLCEWDKYERARLGEGRPRSKYRPPIS